MTTCPHSTHHINRHTYVCCTDMGEIVRERARTRQCPQGALSLSLLHHTTKSTAHSIDFVHSVQNDHFLTGESGVTADRDKTEFRLFNSSSIFNITLREELFSSPKQNHTMHPYPNSSSIFNITLREGLY